MDRQPTLKERIGRFLIGDELTRVEESFNVMRAAYFDGPWTLPPDELIKQLGEYDSSILFDMVNQLEYEAMSVYGYTVGEAAERKRAEKEAVYMWKYNPLAQWSIWLWTNYGLGENVVVKIPDNEPADEVIQEFWDAPRNQNVLAQDRIHFLSNWLLVRGNQFMTFYASEVDGETQVRKVNADQITEIITHPEDDSMPLFYKRVWTTAGSTEQKQWYYPDWRAYFSGELDKEYNKGKTLAEFVLPKNATRADTMHSDTTVLGGAEADATGTSVCMMHIAYNEKSEDMWGWSLLCTASPYMRAFQQFLRDRLTVAASKAMYVRRKQVKGGSRAVAAVRATMQSRLSPSNFVDSNPPAAAGSTDVENEAITSTDLPMSTGASDAKTDGEMFSWTALIGAGVFPHYAGQGDAYRLATATAMEKPLQMQWSRYKLFLSAQFRKMLTIVLMFKEKYGEANFGEYNIEVSTDRLVETDLPGMSKSMSEVAKSMLQPYIDNGLIPPNVSKRILEEMWRIVLQTLGIETAGDIATDEAFGVLSPEEQAALDAEQEAEDEERERLEDEEVVGGDEEDEMFEGHPLGELLKAWQEKGGLREKVDPDTGKVIPRGKPLPPPEGRLQPITPADVKKAVAQWNIFMPAPFKGMLDAEVLPDEEEK